MGICDAAHIDEGIGPAVVRADFSRTVLRGENGSGGKDGRSED